MPTFKASLIAVKNTEEIGLSIIINSESAPYAFMQEDLFNSCARCRGPDRETWRVYREMQKIKDNQTRLISFITDIGELEDPNLIDLYGRKLPVFDIHESIQLASDLKSLEIKSANKYVRTLLNKQGL